jgi:hypothetical protein
LKKANLRLRDNNKILTAQLKAERKEKKKQNPDSWATVRAKHAVLASTADNLKGAKKRNFEALAGDMNEIAVKSVKKNKQSHSEEAVEVQFRETRLVLYKALHEMDREANIAAAVQYETKLDRDYAPFRVFLRCDQKLKINYGGMHEMQMMESNPRKRMGGHLRCSKANMAKIAAMLTSAMAVRNGRDQSCKSCS